jgi:hypothetical protein
MKTIDAAFETVLWILALAFTLTACVSMLSGCASTSDNFDPGFSPDQVSTIESGFGEWPTHRPVEIVSAPGNDCPPEHSGILAWTFPGNAEHETKMCLYLDAINAVGVPNALQRTAAHEMGHALAGNSVHTPDDGPPSTMKASIEQDALTPTAYDLTKAETVP